MDDTISTYYNPIDWISDTSKLKLINPQSSNLWDYFKRNLFCNYRASSDNNPNTPITVKIFTVNFEAASEKYEAIEIIYDKYHELQSSRPSVIEDEIDEYLGEMSQGFLDDDKEEKELFLHDSRHQGLTMNWKRARELYKKIYKE